MEATAIHEPATDEEVLAYATQKQVLVDEKALKLLARFPQYREVVDRLALTTFMLTEESVNKAIVALETKLVAEPEALHLDKAALKAGARESDARYRILWELDVTDKSTSEGSIRDFIGFFRDKFEFLSGLLRKRQGFQPKGLDSVKMLPPKTACDLIGMVNEKWESKNGNQILRLEDLETELIVVISKENKELVSYTERILQDAVIGVRGQKIGPEMVIANDLFLPDLPQRPFRKAERDVCLASISDLHVGSKLFLEKEFTAFIEWLNGKTENEKDSELVKKIRYLVIAGDCVDGVGIYPDQFDELAVKDIFEQYRKFSAYLQAVPKHIQVIVCPGQHDAVRRAEPQPAIPPEFVPELREAGNVHFVGSPAWVEVEGLNVLVYHGSSVHDLYAAVNFLSPKNPEKALVELLKRRDLMVGYGLKNIYIPEKKDYMLLRLEPDLFIAGDMHRNGYDSYRGCLVVANGTWQTATKFQSEKGHVPTPGRVAIVHLNTGNIEEKRFYGEQ
ncbi:MAG TPA: hypothetical protein HA252_01365 [Candidatus Diapherotrites archaeon]|uniref:DNA polymerase II small subunit n=1 Tax=Candidatus Iainarchaeum sp. TaxID=3101447 RepID=A0A7J4JE67_9ARCH|nr:metallophosphoesterase [Candidatus Diapherotrites archaeon]HIH16033.1 hypothetical protein [Candidatus Diapherotrites archaeon]